MADLVKTYKAKSAKAYVLYNKVRTATAIGRQQQADLSKSIGIKSLKTELPLAAAYENIQFEGLKALTGKHRETLQQLALEIIR
jgi:cellulose biosynthesis protein BcsQ